MDPRSALEPCEERIERRRPRGDPNAEALEVMMRVITQKPVAQVETRASFVLALPFALVGGVRVPTGSASRWTWRTARPRRTA